jgi:hypothetical protein
MSVAENVEALPRASNYQLARFNAVRHGVLSQYTVLPWEDGNEYCALIEALVAEHKPQGPTEEHLVEELAGIVWRKRRLRLAESAAHHRALKRATQSHQETVNAALVCIADAEEKASAADAIRATEAETAEALADLPGRTASSIEKYAMCVRGRNGSIADIRQAPYD